MRCGRPVCSNTMRRNWPEWQRSWGSKSSPNRRRRRSRPHRSRQCRRPSSLLEVGRTPHRPAPARIAMLPPRDRCRPRCMCEHFTKRHSSTRTQPERNGAVRQKEEKGAPLNLLRAATKGVHTLPSREGTTTRQHLLQASAARIPAAGSGVGTGSPRPLTQEVLITATRSIIILRIIIHHIHRRRRTW